MLGCEVVSVIPGIGAIGKAVLFHYERYGGNGYPSGLKGEEIPLEARILLWQMHSTQWSEKEDLQAKNGPGNGHG